MGVTGVCEGGNSCAGQPRGKCISRSSGSNRRQTVVHWPTDRDGTDKCSLEMEKLILTRLHMEVIRACIVCTTTSRERCLD